MNTNHDPSFARDRERFICDYFNQHAATCREQINADMLLAFVQDYGILHDTPRWIVYSDTQIDVLGVVTMKVIDNNGRHFSALSPVDERGVM